MQRSTYSRSMVCTSPNELAIYVAQCSNHTTNYKGLFIGTGNIILDITSWYVI